MLGSTATEAIICFIFFTFDCFESAVTAEEAGLLLSDKNDSDEGGGASEATVAATLPRFPLDCLTNVELSFMLL